MIWARILQRYMTPIKKAVYSKYPLQVQLKENSILFHWTRFSQRNDWQQKVECSGISIKEASDFRVDDEGVCEKIDENTWQVVKPLRIRLLK